MHVLLPQPAPTKTSLWPSKQDDAGGNGALLGRGFDPNTVDPKGLSGLYLALREPSPEGARTLIDWPKTNVEIRTDQDESPLMMAALKGQLDMARRLIERGADVNKTGWTPLHYAATGGHLEIIQLLLDNYAYIDAESPNGSTPLMMAAHYGTPARSSCCSRPAPIRRLRNQLGLTRDRLRHPGRQPDSADLIAQSVRTRAAKRQMVTMSWQSKLM